MSLFERVLIANRGEIARRVQRTCHRLGIETVAVYSDADAAALHVREADRAFRLGAAAAADSYLDIGKIIAAAEVSGAAAIHPGYGFLAENAEFARAVAKAGLVLIGPSADTMEKMGSKAAARQTMQEAGVPVLPGYHGDDQDDDRLQQEAADIGYPVLIKPAAGGGGKGMRVVRAANDFQEALQAARREAAGAFGDRRMILERYLEQPSHIEVQISGDRHGNVVHLFERDCSTQRRYQKIIEEAPAGKLANERQQAMYEAAVRAARAVDYTGAGTVEFIVEGGEFYFMEMNTRLQVEHPVTEMITGLDLVEWQLRVAAGEALPLRQEQISRSGHAIEARIYAEDPEHGFLPSSGRLERLAFPPESPNLRVDTGVREGDTVTIHYDPMIAKLVVRGDDRQAALLRLRQALAATCIDGVRHNLGLLQWLAGSEVFTGRKIHTAWLDRRMKELLDARPKQAPDELIALAGLLYLYGGGEPDPGCLDPWSPWAGRDGWRLGSAAGIHARRSIRLECGGRQHYLQCEPEDHGRLRLLLDESGELQAEGFWQRDGLAGVLIGGQQIRYRVHGLPGGIELVDERTRWRFTRVSELVDEHRVEAGQDRINAPMPGRIAEVRVKPGDRVVAGDVLVVMEAMKMEISLRAEVEATVKAVHASVDESVAAETCVVEFE